MLEAATDRTKRATEIDLRRARPFISQVDEKGRPCAGLGPFELAVPQGTGYLVLVNERPVAELSHSQLQRRDFNLELIMQM